MNLSVIKERIEQMSVHHQIEVLQIVYDLSLNNLNENKNGVFINLTQQSPDTIEILSNYIQYITKQQSQLTEMENETDKLGELFGNVRYK